VLLLNDSGAVIGVTQSIDTSSGSSSGIGFANSFVDRKAGSPALITTGHSDHPYLGVSVITLDPNMATAYEFAIQSARCFSRNRHSGGPADNAGIKASNTI